MIPSQSETCHGVRGINSIHENKFTKWKLNSKLKTTEEILLIKSLSGTIAKTKLKT